MKRVIACMIRAALGAVLMLGLARVASAQSTCTDPSAPSTCITTTGATLTIPRVVQLTLAGTATVVPTPSDTDYAVGHIDVTGQTVTIQSNANVVVTLAAGASTWTATNTTAGVTAWATKPSTDLLFATTNGGPFAPLTTTATTLASSGPSTGVNLTIAYRTLLSWTLDTPGQYTLNVVYTITAP